MRLVGTTGNGVVNAIDRLIVPPWLRVSMGVRPASSSPGLLANSNADSARSSLELEGTPRDNLLLAGRPAALNLPSLGSKPLRFEQPEVTRLLPTNSFLLTGNAGPGPLTGGNSLLDSGFDAPLPPPAGSGEPDVVGASLASTNLTVPAGSRLGSASRTSNELFNATTTTTTTSRNLQLIEKLASLMKARKFVKYLLRSRRLGESLKPDMNYVVLVPTDQALEKLPRQIIDMLERDPERLSDLVNYHILDTTFEYINTIPDGQTLNTLNEKDILFNWHRNNTVLTASGAVVLGGVQEENIALLIVDRVLYPTPGDLLSIISKSPILSNLTQLVRNAGLEQQLSMAGPYSLFAPSDFAFNQLDKRDLDFLQRNRETARRFLLRHLSQPAVFTSSIALSNSTDPTSAAAGIGAGLRQVPTMVISNSLGEDLILRQRNDYFSVNDVNFSYADVAATNGVVHVIDGLL